MGTRTTLLLTLLLTLSFSAITKDLFLEPKTNLAASKNKDSIWGYNSEGRELFDIVTNKGTTIRAVDVDGFAYSGDMILGKTKDLKRFGLRLVSGREFAKDNPTDPNAIIRYPSSGYKWTNGEVPYEFAVNLGTRSRQSMQYSINHWNTHTSVRFVPRTNQRDYLFIQNGQGCNSWIRRQGGKQVINLAEACGNGAAFHEIGHAIGFFHEQTRTDQANYVTIYWNNIERGMDFNFQITSTSEGRDHGVYDYYSIMHYSTRAFGVNGAVTIWPTQNGVDTSAMGTGSILTSGDIAAIAAIYAGDDDGGGNIETFRGNLSGANDSDVQPDGNWFLYEGGSLKSILVGPNDTDFELSLYYWNGRRWEEVASSTLPTSSEKISYAGGQGYYYFRVYSYSGQGNCTLTLER